MTLTLPPINSAAAERFSRNCRGLGLDLPLPQGDFCLARDGSTTAKRDGQWLAGCSVPRRAAEVMLRNENWAGRSLCLLAPTHGQQIVATLVKLGPTKGLIVIASSKEALADLLAVGDFADDITAGRLHFAWDDASLRQVFQTSPGLPVPQQMVRLPDADAETVAAVLAWAQPTLGAITADYGKRLQAASADGQSANKTNHRRILAGRHFRLWNDAGETLADLIGSTSEEVLDLDRPTLAADAFVAEQIADAGAVITSGRSRPAWAKSPAPWINWQTTPNVPPFDSAYPEDALLLADESFRTPAIAAGWPVERLAIARWPAESLGFTPGAPLALIADLPSLDPPADIAEYSSRQVVWEAIADELSRNPFAVGQDPTAYVNRAPARLNLPPADDFPTQRYVDALIGPAFTLGLANWLAMQNVPFTIHGEGWEKETKLAAFARGPVADRAAFRGIVAASGGLIDPFLTTAGHPIRSLGIPVIRTFGQTLQRVLLELKSPRLNASISSTLTRQTIETLVR